MTLLITPIYAAILALLFVCLSVRVIKMRRKNRIALGDGQNMELLRALRAHSNFAEYTPMALILMMCVELQSSSVWIINTLGVFLLIGRSCHAYGVSQIKENFRFRTIGMIMTFSMMLIACGLIIYSHLMPRG